MAEIDEYIEESGLFDELNSLSIEDQEKYKESISKTIGFLSWRLACAKKEIGKNFLNVLFSNCFKNHKVVSFWLYFLSCLYCSKNFPVIFHE